MYSNSKGFLDQYTRVVWVQFSNMKYSQCLAAPDDGHHYDVTSKCCGVTITTRLVEWTLSISEINVFFCYFQEVSGLKNANGYSVRGGGKNPETGGRGIFAPTLNLVVSWLAIPTAHVVSL